jgi:hypothetical protein
MCSARNTAAATEDDCFRTGAQIQRKEKQGYQTETQNEKWNITSDLEEAHLKCKNKFFIEF